MSKLTKKRYSFHSKEPELLTRLRWYFVSYQSDSKNFLHYTGLKLTHPMN